MMMSLVLAAVLTPWGEKVTAENAWREYPRPQMVRDNWTCLNGEWDYAITSVTNTPGRPEKWDGKILVPFAFESSLSGVGRLLKPNEHLWYSRTITVNPKPVTVVLVGSEFTKTYDGTTSVTLPRGSYTFEITTADGTYTSRANLNIAETAVAVALDTLSPLITPIGCPFTNTMKGRKNFLNKGFL